MWKKIVSLLVVLSLMVIVVGCGVVPTIPPTPSSELVLVRVTDPQSNLISVAGIENEDAMAILGDKDTEGNPTSITGAVYVLEQGDAFSIDAGIDGLPTYLIDSEGNKVLFENYTDSTVDISIYDSNENLVQEPITINIESEDLLEIKQLYDSFYSQQKDAETNVADDIVTGLRWGAKAIPWVACGITGAAFIPGLTTALLPLVPYTAYACAGTIVTTAFSASESWSLTEYEKEALTAAGCKPANPAACVSAIIYVVADAIEENYGTNQPPVITSTPVTSATIGQLYSYSVTADDPNGDVLTYSLTTNKPNGMEIVPFTGFISWIPTVSGNFDVTIEVSDGKLSDTQSFTITVEEPDTSIGQVQLSSPLNGATISTSTVVLSWNSVSGATGYEVVYDTSSNFTNPIGWTVSGTSKTTGTLADGKTYYWRVRAFVNSQYFPWSSVWNFTKSGTASTQNVTLVLYICENSTSGPPLSGVSVGVVDGAGNSSSYVTNSSGYVTITGISGTWHFSAMKSGYETNNWSQPITTNCTKYGYIKSNTTINKPDLIVSKIWTEPNPPIAAGFTTIGIQVKNQGNTSTTENFYLEFYLDNTYQGHAYINGLTAGSATNSYWKAITWPSDTNLHIIKGVVDPDNIVIESNETNNQYSIQANATELPTGTGTLKVESVPGIAKVYIDDIYKGETPSSGYLTISNLTAGDHNLKVTKSGYKDWIGVVTIPLGSIQYKAVILESITSPRPNPPTPLSPGSTSAPGPVINTLTPTLQWQAVPNADYYNLSISVYPYGTSNIIYNPQQITGSSITVPSGVLEGGKKYRWNMRAHNSAGFSDYSINLYFQTETNIVPPTGLSVSSYWNTTPPGFPSMVLSWNAVSGATGYEMWVRPAGGSSAYLGTRDAPYVTFNSNSLPGGTRYVSGITYYFKVRTITASGTSAFTSEVSCVAASAPPPSLGQVQLLVPSNGGSLPPMNVTFWWNPVSNATKYQFVLYNPKGQIALDKTISTTSIIVTLGTEETITWKVRAGDNSGNWGPWSSIWSLNIKSLI